MHAQYPGYGPPQRQPDGSTVYAPSVPQQQQQVPQYQPLPPQQYQPPPYQPPSLAYGPGTGNVNAAPMMPPPGTQGYAGYVPNGQPTPYPQPYAPQHQPTPPMPPMQPAYGQGLPPYGQPTYGQQPMAAPQTFIPNDAEFQAMYQRAQEQQARIAAARGGGGARKGRDLRFLGPNGEKKWTGVPIGYKRSLVWRILPSGVQGVGHFVELPKHFWKSQARPNGDGGYCPGQSCRLCAAVMQALGTGNEQTIKRANMAKAKPHRLYQGLCYGSYEQMTRQLDDRGWLDLHRDEFGKVRPLVYDTPSDVHMAIINAAASNGLHTLLDLTRGEPVIVTRRKTGPEEQNIAYDFADGRQFAGAFPPWFGFGPNGEGLELYDLRKFAKAMSDEDQLKAINDLGFVQGPQNAYGQQPQAPNPSPYGQPYQARQPAQQPWAPQQMQLPPVSQHPTQPPPGWGAPPQGPPPSPSPPAPPGWVGPTGQPPVLPSTGQPPPSSYAQPRAPDPWADGQQQQRRPDEPPAGWTPPPPPAQQWGQQQQQASTQPAPQPWGQTPPPAPTNPAFAALQAQLNGTVPAPVPGPGPAYPPPPGAASPPQR